MKKGSTTQQLVALNKVLRKRNAKNNPSAQWMVALLYIYAFAGLMFLTAGVLVTEDNARVGLALAGMCAVGTGAFLLATIALPSMDKAVSPADLATLPLSSRVREIIAPATAIMVLSGTRGILVVLASTITMLFGGYVLSAQGHLGTLALWIPAVLISAITTLLLGEVIAGLGMGSSSRTGKERANIAGYVLLFVAIMAFSLFSSGMMRTVALSTLGQYLSWTPLAAAPGAVGHALAGQWLAAGAQMLIAAGTLVGGVWLWSRQLKNQSFAPLDSSGGQNSARRVVKEGEQVSVLVPGAPATAFGYIYSRALRYLRRDSRMLATLITYPLLAALLTVQGIMTEPAMVFVSLFLMALFVGAPALNDHGFDGPSQWNVIVAGIPTRTVVLARHVASITPMLGFYLVMIVVTAVVSGDLAWTARLSVLAFGMSLSSAAVAVFLSAYSPFPTARPGTNLWKDKSGYSAPAFVGAFALILLGWVPSVPGIAAVIYGVSHGLTAVWIAGLAVGVLLPAGIYALALKLAVQRVSKHQPEIFAKVNRFVD